MGPKHNGTCPEPLIRKKRFRQNPVLSLIYNPYRYNSKTWDWSYLVWRQGKDDPQQMYRWFASQSFCYEKVLFQQSHNQKLDSIGTYSILSNYNIIRYFNTNKVEFSLLRPNNASQSHICCIIRIKCWKLMFLN